MLISSKEISFRGKKSNFQKQFLSQHYVIIVKHALTDMKCVRIMTGSNLIDRIKNEDLRKQLRTEAAIDHIKK
jgi:hypothetical protein